MIGITQYFDDVMFMKDNPFGIEALYFLKDNFNWNVVNGVAKGEIEVIDSRTGKPTDINQKATMLKKKWSLPTIEELKYIINDLTIEYIKDNIFGIWQICLWSADEDSETDRWAWAIHIAGEVRDNAVDVWKVFKKNPHSAILVLKSK